MSSGTKKMYFPDNFCFLIFNRLDLPNYKTPGIDLELANSVELRQPRTSIDSSTKYFENKNQTFRSMGLDLDEDIGVDYESAIFSTGFGKFHFKVLLLNGLIYLNSAIGITILSFVLPAATCDFQMTSSDKGLLTAAPMLGMVLGSYFWGCLADTRGRRVVLIATLLLDGISGLLSSISQYFILFAIFRFICGFGITGAMGICFPYLGEFQSTKYREKMLSWLELFWVFGIIALPLIAWAIIPIDFGDQSTGFLFNSWNLFVAICAIPSLLLGTWLFWFPETPKFLIECGDVDEALVVLQNIFQENTGKDASEYPIKSLKPTDRVSKISTKTEKSVRELRFHKHSDMKLLAIEVWHQTKQLFKEPHLKNTILTCLIQFGLTTSYYTLMIWFPELFDRFETFEKENPDTSASVCDVSEGLTNATDFTENCSAHIEDGVYIHTLIIGAACIPTSIWLGLCVHKLGTKFFLVFTLLVSGAVTVGLYFVVDSTQNLVLSAIFESLTSVGISTVYCVLVDLFPTNLRVMAAALSLTFGRIGALVGNLVFGFLIDLNCVVPIILFAGMLFISGILCFFLPKTGHIPID